MRAHADTSACACAHARLIVYAHVIRAKKNGLTHCRRVSPLYRCRRLAKGTFAAAYYKRMLFKWTSRCARIYARTRTRSIANSTRKRIAVTDAWATSECKRDCVLRVASKTFRMYYTSTKKKLLGILMLPRSRQIVLAVQTNQMQWFH